VDTEGRDMGVFTRILQVSVLCLIPLPRLAHPVIRVGEAPPMHFRAVRP